MSRTVKRVSPEFAAMDYDGDWSDDGEHTFNGEPGMDPPEGESWQVRQDVGEETPISPVFATKEECANWVARTHECSAAAAAKFVEDGWAPSFIGTGFGFYSGVQMAAGLAAHLSYLAPEGSHPTGTRVRHRESGVEGELQFRMPAPNDEYYLIRWDRALPSLLAGDPSLDPDKPMDAGCRAEDGFDVIEPVTTH